MPQDKAKPPEKPDQGLPESGSGQKEQPPLNAQMQAMEGAANQADSPYQSVTNLIDAIANYIYEHRNEPNVLEYFSHELRDSSGILANSALKSDGPKAESGKARLDALMELENKLGPTPASAYADREHPSADELSVRRSLEEKRREGNLPNPAYQPKEKQKV